MDLPQDTGNEQNTSIQSISSITQNNQRGRPNERIQGFLQNQIIDRDWGFKGGNEVEGYQGDSILHDYAHNFKHPHQGDSEDLSTNYTVEAATFDHLEEDLAGIPDYEFYFSKEERSIIEQEAFEEAWDFAKKYLPLANLNQKFPQPVNFDNPKSLEDLGIKSLIIPGNLYLELTYQLTGKDISSSELGCTFNEFYLSTRGVGIVDTSQKRLIFAKETMSVGAELQNYNPDDVHKALTWRLKQTLKHELFHKLFYTDPHNKTLDEGFIELFNKISAPPVDDRTSEILQKINYNPYETNVQAASTFMIALLESGKFSMQDVIKYFTGEVSITSLNVQEFISNNVEVSISQHTRSVVDRLVEDSFIASAVSVNLLYRTAGKHRYGQEFMRLKSLDSKLDYLRTHYLN